MNLLGGLNRSEFLQKYWQKKPLLIQQALPDFTSPISAEELAGLACEANVESRLILEQGDDGPWQCQHGPFDESVFQNLPESNWTLLVQAVDHYLPEIAVLLERFDFIPGWRTDDVMISYAPVNGSVGPHLDNYDVFLVQAEGRRHWHINKDDYSEADFTDGLDLRIIDNFQWKEDWILEPGDMLYLPPGIAHHGIALEDCLTYSIGFRAPTQLELLDAYMDQLHEQGKDNYYSDPELQIQKYRGEIKKEHIENIRQHMLSALSEKDNFSNWFGCYITENAKHEILNEEPETSLNQFLIQFKQASRLIRYGSARISYIHTEDSIQLYVAGNKYDLPVEKIDLARDLSSLYSIEYSSIREAGGDNVDDLALKLLFNLYNQGYFYFDESH